MTQRRGVIKKIQKKNQNTEQTNSEPVCVWKGILYMRVLALAMCNQTSGGYYHHLIEIYKSILISGRGVLFTWMKCTSEGIVKTV